MITDPTPCGQPMRRVLNHFAGTLSACSSPLPLGELFTLRYNVTGHDPSNGVARCSQYLAGWGTYPGILEPSSRAYAQRGPRPNLSRARWGVLAPLGLRTLRVLCVHFGAGWVTCSWTRMHVLRVAFKSLASSLAKVYPHLIPFHRSIH